MNDFSTERSTTDAITTGLAGVGLIALSWVAMTDRRAAAVDRVGRRIGSVRLGRPGDILMSAATDLGSVYAILGSGAVLHATGRQQMASDVVGAGLFAWCAAQVAKRPVKRPRPYEADAAARIVAVPSGSSWPSGHTAQSTAVAVAAIPHVPPRLRGVLAGYAGFVGVSRIYVGVHYPTDVVAGIGVGMVSAVVAKPFGRIAGPAVRALGKVVAANARAQLAAR